MSSIQHIHNIRVANGQALEVLVQRGIAIYHDQERNRYFVEIMIQKSNGKKQDIKQILQSLRETGYYNGGHFIIRESDCSIMRYGAGQIKSDLIGGRRIIVAQPFLPNDLPESINVEQNKKFQGRYVFNPANYRHLLIKRAEQKP